MGGEAWVTDTKVTVHACSMSASYEATYLGEVVGHVETSTEVIAMNDMTGEAGYWGPRIFDGYTEARFDFDPKLAGFESWEAYDGGVQNAEARHKVAMAAFKYIREEGPYRMVEATSIGAA